MKCIAQCLKKFMQFILLKKFHYTIGMILSEIKMLNTYCISFKKFHTRDSFI